ncbi:MAG TPA: NAD(P)/FAD-dependent oxidoreductase [Steroidobacteraceae bacterium]|jgi:L-2-hydroxyglutarate oxidase LhgO|nr:NAD(P)/FAD-dependent oxidoreductase [Steroidobacteraceae bacterium]
MTERIDCAVIGAGVVGLATARALALAGREVLVLEAEGSIGTGTSSRNSEVIHAGIYYLPGTLKARFCVTGRTMLYDYVAHKAVEFRRLGKLIVAASADEAATLSKYEAQAIANGVTDLRRLEAEEVRELEPSVRCTAAVLSPSSGIIDSHALMLSFRADLEAHGGIVVCNSTVVGGELHDAAVTLEIDDESRLTLSARAVVNCAGLEAQAVSATLDGLPPQTIPERFLAKGHYFSLAGRSPFRRLVYPIANAAGLGTHVTLDLAGNARFGPDVQWIDVLDYGFDAARKGEFVQAIRRYYPELDESRLLPAYTGIRPKISGPGQAAADFCIRGPADHSHRPYVALYGIESPGLTASMAIAEYVEALLRYTPSTSVESRS